MPVMLSCACGRTLRVPDPAPGARVRCPACAAVLTVPTPETGPRPGATGGPAGAPTPPSPATQPTDGGDTDRGGYGLEPVGERASPQLAPQRRNRKGAGGDAGGGSRRLASARASRTNRRRSGKKAAQRGVYLVGGALAVIAGVGLILVVRSTAEPGAGKVTVGGAILALFGIVSIIQAIIGAMPDDDV